MARKEGVPGFGEMVRVFARIGCLSFGGPAGQIALMHREIVEQRGWLDEGQFLHALNFCHLLPGPEAQQLATWIGWRCHGTRGGRWIPASSGTSRRRCPRRLDRDRGGQHARRSRRGSSGLFYRVRLKANTASFGPGKPVIPGMTGEVAIKSGSQTILNYILGPLIRVGDSALRE